MKEDIVRLQQVISVSGLIISLGTLAATFLNQNYYIASLIFLIVILFFYYFWSSFKQRDYNILFREFIYTIEDDKGSKAHSRVTKNIRANHNGLSRYIHRNISADGEISGFKTNHGHLRVEKSAGDYSVYHAFPRGLKKWQKITVDLEYDFKDCFTGNPEGVICLVETKTKNTKIEINLPKSRPCKSARVIYRHGINEEEIEPPIISNDKCKIIWARKKLNKIGAEYEIEWEW